ncbi:MAG: molybdate transport system substrate-binding protein [Solirubrobacteraceae bacterium]|nr:molybdate transport system substrate-binding protein [Solirubrobacteraceae bacterium]
MPAPTLHRQWKTSIAVAAAALLVALPAGSVAHAQVSAKAAGKGPVSVLFAGSLVNYAEHDLGPAFQRAAGYSFEGFGGGSTELANEIKGGVRQGDVFLSASATADRALEGSRNGNWVSWYSSFMASPLVLAYNPRSRFGAELAHGKPWYQVLTQRGIRVGRTDPKLDPKGVLSAEAISGAASKLRLPALARAEARFETFPETTLVGRMQAGQLDAGFFYAVEAKTAKLATVSLAPVYKYAEYTITILNRAPDRAGAASFLGYLLSADRSYTLRKDGLNPMKPRFSGRRTAVPAALRKLVGTH